SASRRLRVSRYFTCSPGSAPSMKTTLPSTRATPRPSSVRSTIAASDSSSGSGLGFARDLISCATCPEAVVLRQMRRCVGGRQQAAHVGDLGGVVVGREIAAHELEAQI